MTELILIIAAIIVGIFKTFSFMLMVLLFYLIVEGFLGGYSKENETN